MNRLSLLIVLVLVIVAHPSGPPLWAQCEVEEVARILSPEPGEELRFPTRVAVWGDRLLVSDPGLNQAPGNAYIYSKTPQGWQLEQELIPQDDQRVEGFGHAVALGEHHAIVAGLRIDSKGYWSEGIYVFRRTETTWHQEQRLSLDSPSGYPLVLEQDWLFVFDSTEQPFHFVRVFKHDGTSFEETQQLRPSDPLDTSFGRAMAIRDSHAVIGAASPGSRAGASYVYELDGPTWVERQRLQGHGPGDEFGHSVGLAGDWIAVGALGYDWNGMFDTGAVHMFSFDGSSWTEQQTLAPNDVSSEDAFSFSLDFRDGNLIVGAPNQSVAWAGHAGSLHHFVAINGIWTERARSVASDFGTGDHLGLGVSVYGNTVAAPIRENKALYLFTSDPTALSLESSPQTPLAGDLLELATTHAPPQTPALLVAAEISGQPTFTIVASGIFDENSMWTFEAIVPPGLQGIDVTFQSYGVALCGAVTASNPSQVQFQ